MKKSGRMLKKQFVLAVTVAACLKALAAAVPYERLPVSDPCNPMYLKGMTDKPWWDDAWKFRLPVVVSESSTNEVAAFVADFEVDLGRPGMADSVRVVTDYGEEIPCWAAAMTGTVVRVQFKTQINAAENKCFHLYFDNPKAKRPAYPDEVTAFEHGSLITVRNSSLTVDFTRQTRNADVVKRFRVNGSWADNELTLLPCQTVDRAFRVQPSNGQRVFTNRVTLALSTPFMKQVRVENGVFSSTYTMFSDSDRLDYSFVPTAKGVFFRTLGTSWAPGGGRSWDDILYPSLVGMINSDRAQIDYRSDSNDTISHNIGEWSGEGWYAIRDRKTVCSVGQFYSGADVQDVGQNSWNGDSGARCHDLVIRLVPDDKKRPQGEIRGAAFGTLARADVIRGEYRVWANPPRIFAGRAEPWRRIEVRPPDMAHDFCTFQQLGPGRRTILGDEPGLPEEAGENIARYLRRDGFNGAHLVQDAANWWNWNPDKELFDEICAAWTNKTYGGDGKAQTTWAESRLGSRNLRVFLDTLHRNGIGAYHWGCALFGKASTCDALLTQERPRELDIEVMGRTHAAFGFDATWCGMQGREGPMMMQADWKNLGNRFWKYKNRADTEAFLKLQDMRVEHARRFCETVRKAGGKPLAWGCDLGLLGNEQFSLDNAGDFDVVIQELMIAERHHCNERNRFGSARMRAMFDNEPHTVWNHFWSRIAGDDIRIGNCDLPFIYGVNGFNQEGDDYRQVDAEIVTKGTDFYRFAYNTGLAAFSPKFTPVKYINVFRDQNDHRADILEGRTGNKWMYAHGWDDTTETDGAANIWATAPAIHTDLTLNRFFTLKSLKRYPMLALPHNYKLTREQFKIVLQYVKDGGVCYAEGAKFPFAKYFTEGATKVEKSKYEFSVKTFGKGKLLYSPKNPSLEKFALHPNREFRSFLVKEIGHPEPLVVEPRYAGSVDGMLRTDGKNWMFGSFAFEMPGGTAAVVRATFNLPLEKNRKYFALDMRSGRRVPFDGTLEFTQRPRAVTHWLIGDEAFTAVPEYTLCRTFDFGAVKPVALTEGAKKNLAARDGLGDFTKPLAVLLIQEPDKKGETHENRTIQRGAYRQELMSRANYEAKAFGEALASVKVLHLLGIKGDIVEKIFAENGEALREFLKNGGTVMFDRTKTSPAATAFLKSVGVYDVNASRVTGGDYWGKANFDALGKDHELFTKPWNIYQPWMIHRMQAKSCFTKWDERTQFAPLLVVERDSPDKKHLAAMCVCQEKVCGAGKVIFQQNDAAFTSWYECVTYGENLLSWAFGLDLKTHKLKVQQLYGGFGTPVEFPATVRNGF